jgi:hypothetical protein
VVPDASLTAYRDEEATLRQRLSAARVAAASLRRPIARCELGACLGMCCHDGVYVPEESARVIEGLTRRHAGFFRGLGLRLPERVIVEGRWTPKPGGLKTAVRRHPFARLVPGFPAHFAQTACVFLTPTGLCSLQLLSEHLGRHPWYYKPVKCWMHPLTLEGERPPVLVLHDERTDPYRLPGYDGFVSRIFCGRTCRFGAPAGLVLRAELAFLSCIAGRDFLGAAAAACGETDAK